jgi:hypothetical protein
MSGQVSASLVCSSVVKFFWYFYYVLWDFHGSESMDCGLMDCDSVWFVKLNSNTHPNQTCLCDRCAGLKDADFEFGSCSDKDPCDPNPCSDDKQCVLARKVCLSMLHKPCPQYQCGECTCLSHFVPFDYQFAQTTVQFQSSVVYSKARAVKIFQIMGQ